MSHLSVMTGFQSEANEWEAIHKYELANDFQARVAHHKSLQQAKERLAKELQQQREEFIARAKV